MERSLKYCGKFIGFIVAASYGLVSISITIFNKLVLSHYNFPYANAIATGQAIFSISVLLCLNKFKIITLPKFDYNTMKSLKWLIISFIGMVVTGLLSLHLVNITMYTILRRITTIVTLLLERKYLSKRHTLSEVVSVLLILLGASLAGARDMQFSLKGYILIGLNCIFTATYLICIHLTKKTEMNAFSLMFYTNIFGAPIFFIMFMIIESNDIMLFKDYNSVGFMFSLIMALTLGFVLNCLIFLCSRINSPLTTSITGQIKNVITSAIGFFIFDGSSIDKLGTLGLITSTLSSIWYGQIKYVQGNLHKQEKELDSKC